MKSFLIAILVLGLLAITFLTRPQKDDFERFIRAHPQIAEGKSGPSMADTLGEKIRTFANAPVKNPVDDYLERCTYDNYLLWTTISKDGKPVYTGMYGHWWERHSDAVVAPTTSPAK